MSAIPYGVKELERGAFSDPLELVINYKGENYYKSCPHVVTREISGAATFCLKRVDHPGDIHEDWEGNQLILVPRAERTLQNVTHENTQ